MSEQANSLSVVTILPAPSQSPSQAQPAQGTRVILSDGSELTGITGLTLTAKAGGLWEATITVLPEIVQPVAAEATVVFVEVTALADEDRKYARSQHDPL